MFEGYFDAPNRFEFWVRFLSDQKARTVAEIGVYRGEFAAKILGGVPSIERYTMVDPWRGIPDWNKPANTDDVTFEKFYREALSVTEFALEKRCILRGKTTEVVDRIPNESLDFAYIDGDHTLKGITIDLISIYPKIKLGGWLVGDDFCESIWQHPDSFEPTLIFPFAVYFAEAHGLPIYGLPYNQFAIRKIPEKFEFKDLTGSYGDTSIKRHVVKPIRQS